MEVQTAVDNLVNVSWLVFIITCSTLAEEVGMLVVSVLLNSSRQCSKASPVWPMHTSVHEANDT